jgi:Lamin Tail Domain
MQRFKVFVSSCLLLISPFLPVYQSYAVSTSMVISQIVAGTTNPSAPTQEFVSLYNNSDVDVNITNWCITNKSSATFACVTAPANVKVYVHARSYVKIASQSFATANPGQYDVTFPVTNQSSGSITLTDTVTLIDAGGQAVDSATLPSNFASGNVWQRNTASPGILQDTDVSTDFTRVTSGLIMPASGTFEIETIIDVCPNIAGAQATIPTGLVIDAAGNCVTPPPVDVCPNIAGLQIEMPAGFMTDGQGACYQDLCSNIAGLQAVIPNDYDQQGTNCIEHDECPNVVGTQSALPSGYKKIGGECVLDLLPLQLTEILPNPAGSDTGHEYIELYNPTERSADLGLYTLYVGVNNEKSYSFPAGSQLSPGEYAVFYDSDMKFTLVNSAGKVSLAGTDGTMINQTDSYANPGDDEAWALIDGSWQYTNQPTPGTTNLPSPGEAEDTTDGSQGMAACPTGKYRNPLTNRCRNIESDATVLAACDGDQYRNPETGRCRKIATAGALAPCKDGQYRSEETNRCRNISASSATLTPCKEGQERNPDTNRCRNVAAKSVPNAAFAVQPVKDGGKSFIGWWALGGVGALALGYAGWEWRYEARRFIRNLKLTVHSK